MARRALVVWIDTDGRDRRDCGMCRFWEIDDEGYQRCRIFGRLDVTSVHLFRHPECLRAETFAGG